MGLGLNGNFPENPEGGGGASKKRKAMGRRGEFRKKNGTAKREGGVWEEEESYGWEVTIADASAAISPMSRFVASPPFGIARSFSSAALARSTETVAVAPTPPVRASKQEEDRVFFMAQLGTDRDKFAAELDGWEVEIKTLNQLGDMADVEANAARVEARGRAVRAPT